MFGYSAEWLQHVPEAAAEDTNDAHAAFYRDLFGGGQDQYEDLYEEVEDFADSGSESLETAILEVVLSHRGGPYHLPRPAEHAAAGERPAIQWGRDVPAEQIELGKQNTNEEDSETAVCGVATAEQFAPGSPGPNDSAAGNHITHTDTSPDATIANIYLEINEVNYEFRYDRGTEPVAAAEQLALTFCQQHGFQFVGIEAETDVEPNTPQYKLLFGQCIEPLVGALYEKITAAAE